MDGAVKEKLEKCLQLESPKSFFLSAGAGAGKTRSLVELLKYIIGQYSVDFKTQGKYVAVITYTNAAADEIKNRLDFDPLVKVSTIHSFVWEIIKGFDEDIKAFLKKNLQEEINDIRAKQAKGRSHTQNRQKLLEKKEERLSFIPKIKHFVYNPTGDNRERNSLNHAEVIQIGADFISNKKVLQNIIIQKFPILLIDECQDTNRYLIDALFALQKAYRSKFTLGLFGDMMQRIYLDGKEKLEQSLSSEWVLLEKKMNHRSQKRIVDLVNKIRSAADGKKQYPRIEKTEGIVRFFVFDSSVSGKEELENKVKQRMLGITGSSAWNSNEIKTLVLEHRMAARRTGFLNMFVALNESQNFKTGFLDGTLEFVNFFAEIIYPLFTAQEANDQFTIMRILKKYVPALSYDVLKDVPNQLESIKDIKAKLKKLYELYKTNQKVTFLEILREVQRLKLFDIPKELYAFSKEDFDSGASQAKINSEAQDITDKQLGMIRKFLEGPFQQIQFYSEYIKNKSPFATHQGVKGLEFDHVMVIIDDEDARGFLFKYERLFEVKPLPETNLKNIEEGKETVMDRTRRLFYVACSRAKESLALVIYSQSPKQVEQFLIKNGWALPEEVITKLS